MSILLSAWTVLVAVFFVGIVIWVLFGNKNDFDEAARIPFEEEDAPLIEEKEENKHG